MSKPVNFYRIGGIWKMKRNRIFGRAFEVLLLLSCIAFIAVLGASFDCGTFIAGAAKEEYTISYDANGGYNAPAAQTKISRESILLSKDVPVRDGYSFVGWSTDKYDETVRFMPGDRFSYDVSLTLYAVWKSSGHAHTYIDKIIEPTCTERGYTKHTCTSCGDVKIDSYVQKTGHAVKRIDAVAATCTEEGRSEGQQCTVCGAVVKGLEPVKALGHSIVTDEKEIKPTCTQSGLASGGHCKRCGYTPERETIAPLGHNIVKDSERKATCTQSGYTAGEHCTRCDYKTGGQKLPALGHQLVIDEAKSATCTEGGYTAGKHCTRCDYRQTQHTVAALGHKIVRSDAKNPTCTEDGRSAGERCTRCDYQKGGQKLPALGHRLVTDEAKSATCTESGLSSGKHCTRCDYKKAQKTVAALGHDIAIDKAKAATCTESGLTKGEHCKRCNYKIAQRSIPALGHMLTEVPGKKATCTKSGRTAGKMCERCSYKIDGSTIAPLGHYIINDPAKAATCTESGLSSGKHCSRCDYVVAQNVVAALGHSMVTDKGKQATCTSAGFESSSHCKRCGLKTQRKTIPKKAHSFVKTVTCATMKKDGSIVSRCSFCNAQNGKAQVIYMVKSAVLSKTSFVYSGKGITPQYIVKDRSGRTLKSGKDYSVTYSGNKKVGKAFAKITFKGNYKGEKTLSFTILPAATSRIKIINIASASFKATWTKVPGAGGYKVSLYKNGRCVKSCETSKNYVVFKKLDPGCKYTVKVQAYTYIGSSKSLSPKTKSVKTATKAASPVLTVTAERRQARLSWSKISGAKSYAVYYSTSKDSGFVKITSSANHRVIKKLNTGTRYYFKVVAVKDKKNGPQYTSFSKTVSAVIR